MKPTRWLWAGLGATLALIVGGAIYWSGSGPWTSLAQQAANPTAVPQAVARRGDLAVSVSGSGTLTPVSSSDLGFGQNGTLLEVNVQAGDQVQAGDILARLKTDKTPAEHQAELASATLAVVQAQQAVDQLKSNAGLEAAQALNSVENYQAALEDLKHPEAQQAEAMQAVAQAEQAVATAQMNLYILQSMPSQEAVAVANASLLFKQKTYTETQKSIARLENQIKSAPDETIRDRLETQLIRTRIDLAKQKIEVDNAAYKLANMGAPPDPDLLRQAHDQLTTSQTELAQAQRELENAQAGPSLAALAQVQAQLHEAQITWERLKDGPNPTALEQAETQLAQAQASLALLQQEQLVVDLQAPYNGTILSVNARPGGRVTSGTMITLADLNQATVQVSVDETDLPGIQAGMEAQVAFDALPGDAYSGKVIRIDPSLQRFGNTYAGLVIVRLDRQENTRPQLPLGMNASVDIQIGRTTNAVLVPVEALQQFDNGAAFLGVIQGDQLEKRAVTVGLMDLTMAEITSGLQAGEVVATGPIDFSEGEP